MPKLGIYEAQITNVENGKSPSKGTPFTQVSANLLRYWDGTQYMPNGSGYIQTTRRYFSLDPTKKASHEYSYADLANFGVTDIDPPAWTDDIIQVEIYETGETYVGRDGETRSSTEMRPYNPDAGPRGRVREVTEEEKLDEKTTATLSNRFAAFREKKQMVTAGAPADEPKDDLPF